MPRQLPPSFLPSYLLSGIDHHHTSCAYKHLNHCDKERLHFAKGNTETFGDGGEDAWLGTCKADSHSGLDGTILNRPPIPLVLVGDDRHFLDNSTDGNTILHHDARVGFTASKYDPAAAEFTLHLKEKVLPVQRAIDKVNAGLKGDGLDGLIVIAGGAIACMAATYGRRV
jgi:hypothetical protein